MMGANSSLLTLRLDNNPTMTDDGFAELCKGLRTNRTLKVWLREDAVSILDSLTSAWID